MAGFGLPWRDAGVDLLRVELPGFIVGLQRHIAQLQHVGLYWHCCVLLLQIQRAVTQRDAMEMTRFGNLAQAEAEVQTFGNQ